MEIKFTNIKFLIVEDHEQHKPQPASKFVPDWYKNMDTVIDTGKSLSQKQPVLDGLTIKKCMPVFDALTSGYIIPTPVDVYITQKDNMPWYTWSSKDFEFIQFHSEKQALTHPYYKGLPYPKFINPWGVETPPGYSCLFVTPFHHSLDFTIFPGVVDTDKYTDGVNFPFTLTNLDFEGVIPAGTPMAQVIPFKRDSWKTTWGDAKERDKALKVYNRVQTQFFNVYKTLWRSKKEYL
jgi:hypothetical protein